MVPTNKTPPGRRQALFERFLREEVRRRLGALLELRGRSRHLQGGISRLSSRLIRLEDELTSIQSELPPVPFSPTMTIDQAWKHHGDAPRIFAQHHLPACDSCAIRFDETLEEAARAYGLDLVPLLKELNDLLEGP